MSQPLPPTDTQALLQSMLQRLELQPGSETPRRPNPLSPTSATPDLGQDRGRPPCLQGGPGGNVLSTDGARDVRGVALSPLTSPPAHRDSCTVVPQGPENSRTSGRDSNHVSTSSPVQSESGFTPKVYGWSLKSTNPGLDTAGPVQSAGQGNGGFSDVIGVFSSNQGPAESSLTATKKKNRFSERSKKRWSINIVDRWRERHGSIGKREKKESEAGEGKANFSGPHQKPAAEVVISRSSNEHADHTSQGPVREVPGEAPPTVSDEGIPEGHVRPSSDFDFGLGSFSLLDEILKGQEWARFLSPTQTDIPANHKPDVQPGTNQTFQGQDTNQSSLILTKESEWQTANPQWIFRPAAPDLISDTQHTDTHMSTDASTANGMDISDPSRTHEQITGGEVIQSEPMEHSDVQSQLRSDEARTNPAPQTGFSFIKPEGVLDQSTPKTRTQLNRKRVHLSLEGGVKGEREEEEERDRGTEERNGRLPARGPAGRAEREDRAREDGGFIAPLYPLLSPHPSLSPPSSSPSPAPGRRGILKHSVSRDSESSIFMGTTTKRRRVEQRPCVRFSEKVVSIEPREPLLGDGHTEEEEEEEEEGNCGTEDEESGEEEEDPWMQEEEEAAPMPVAVPVAVARPSLPSWILALKRRKTGRKPRQ